MTKGEILFYARIIPSSGIYDVLELSVRTTAETYFVGTEKRSKQAFLFPYKDLGKVVFGDRKEALKAVKEAEKYRYEVN